MIVSSLAPSAWPAVSDEQLSREILKSVANAANAGHLVEKETVMHSVWKGTFVEERSLAHSISVSRKILGDGTERNRYIETVPRHGYRFIAPVELHEKNPSKEAGSGPPTLHSLAVLPLVFRIPHSKVLEKFCTFTFRYPSVPSAIRLTTLHPGAGV
jgi:DNA-binding winged helix-turn-helix (wHTH) protein